MGAMMDEVLRALSGVMEPVLRVVRGAESIALRGMRALNVSAGAQHSVLLLAWSVLVFLMVCLLEGWARLALLVFVGLLVAEAYGLLS